MNLTKANLVLLAAAVVLAVPTALQLRGETETFVDVGAVPLLFDGFTAENTGQIVLGKPKAEQPPPDPQNPNAPKVAYDQLHVIKSDKGFQLGPSSGDLAGAPVSKERVESDVY